MREKRMYNHWNVINKQKQPLKKVLCKNTEADFRRCSVKKMFQKNSQNSQENTCVRAAFFHKIGD